MDPDYPRPDEVELGYFELSTHLLALEVLKHDLPLRWFNRSFFETVIAGEKVAFWCTRCNANSAVAVKAATRKDMTARILRAADISIAEGKMFRDVEKGATYAKRLGFPLVVKPVSGTKGKGVTVGIKNEDQLRRAWKEATGRARNQRIMIERSFDGREARFLVVGDKCVGVVKRVPPNVTGDGVCTISELIEEKNSSRLGNPHLRSRPILIDDHRLNVIEDAGFELGSVLPEGVYLEVDRKGGFSSGADSVEVSAEVHNSLIDVAVRSAQAFPGLGVSGVDILAQDFAAPAEPDNYIVVEINSMPGIGAHHFPAFGEPKNAAAAILEYFLPKSRWWRRLMSQS